MKLIKVLGMFVLTATALLIGCSDGGSGGNETPNYKVTFEVNGGSAVTAIIDVKEGETIDKPANPTKLNHKFDGWFKDAALTTAWDFATDVVTKNTTLYAKWTLNTYAVTFEVNGGSSVAALPAVTHGTKIIAPEIPSKTGFTFDGWYKEATLTTTWDFAVDVVVAATTLYAKWTPNVYTVTFESNGGTAVASIADIAHGTTITKPADPTNANSDLVFDGWYKEETLKTAWDFATDKVTSNITLYAKWIDNSTTPGTYSITFEVDGGSNVAKITNIESGKKITKPTDPTKDGFVFDGWYKEVTLKTVWNFTTDVVTADITLYAKWALPNNLSVTFEVNGGSNVSKITGITFGETVAEPTAPTKTGSEFAGWFKDEELKTAWDFDVDVVESNITLYAKWTLNKYKVTFVSNGDTEVEPLENIPHGSVISKPEDPTKEFHSLVGWYEDEALKYVWDFASDKVTANMTLYAKWEIATYTMTFESNSGTAVAQITGIAHGAKVTEPNAPSKTGNMFKGWYKDAGLTNPWDFYTDVVNVNTKVFAKWAANVITNGGVNDKGVKVATINGIECVLVEKGVYWMGSSGTGLIERQVTLTKNYWIGKYEITQAQYRDVMLTNPSNFVGLNKPVETVSWTNSINYCAKIGGRLPTEAEWEFAARGGNVGKDNNYIYSGGNGLDTLAWYKKSSSTGTAVVGEDNRKSNDLGIFDMSGNVDEWCSDWWADNYPNIPEADPKGPNTGSKHVVRGGDYKAATDYYSTTTTLKVFGRNSATNANDGTGIRIVFPAE